MTSPRFNFSSLVFDSLATDLAPSDRIRGGGRGGAGGHLPPFFPKSAAPGAEKIFFEVLAAPGANQERVTSELKN